MVYKLKITSLDSLSSIENALQALANDKDNRLQLPKDAIKKYKGAMHDASRLQMLTSWARGVHEPVICFHASYDVKSLFEDLGAYAPGVAALRLAKGVEVGKEFFPRRDALRSATSKMLNTDAYNLTHIIHGRSIDLTCVSGVNVQYLKPLFSSRNKEAVRDKGGMLLTLMPLFELISRGDNYLIPQSFIEACSVFVSELFLNTQEHATSNRFGVPYDAHVEGLIVSWDEMEERFYKNDFTGHKRLEAFWDREVVTVRGGDAIRCLQLSFFDTGPGFASRASGLPIDEMSLAHEREILLACLRKNTTTKRQTGAGNGLPLVLEELKSIGGLIRIRSGRHSIFNCFEVGGSEDLYNFDDWNSDRKSVV